jgi:hypothetical protein
MTRIHKSIQILAAEFILLVALLVLAVWLFSRSGAMPSLDSFPKTTLTGEVIKNDQDHLLIKIIGHKETMLVIEGGVDEFSQGDIVSFSIRDGVVIFEPRKRKIASVTVMQDQ